MARDIVYPRKMESVVSGGSQDDPYPTSLNPNEDYAAARGMLVQGATPGVVDEDCGFERDGLGNFVFWDSVLGVQKTLSQLAAAGSGITPNEHRVIRQLIHFVETGGPAEGFATGAYRQVKSPGAFPDGYVWWESSGMTKKIIEVTLTWVAGQTTIEEWEMYDTDGTTVLATVTDTIVYSGVFEQNRTRAIVL